MYPTGYGMEKLLYIGSVAESRIKMYPVRYQSILYRKIALMTKGHIPDARSLGGGLWEMRIHSSSGYRVYYCNKRGCIWVLLVGTKHTQLKDIQLAIRLQAELVS